jgi:ATP-dependent NAD(P)H-hydrate dehydratase
VHSLIIGPGLGRSEVAFRALKTSVEYAKSRNIPIIIDADGLYILSFDSTIVHGYEKCILTPNLMEFKRLYEASFGKEEAYDETKEHSTLEAQCKAVERLATTFKNLTILKKGRVDIISDGNKTIVNDMEGCLKRCGGIGDILTGTLGTFAFWCSSSQHIEFLSKQEVSQPNLIAAYCATVLTKECSRQAFKKFHRSLLAVDIIEEIAGSFYKIFDKD